MLKMRNDNLRGIGLMLVAMAALTAMDALMKALAAFYPSIQVAALRGLISIPFIVGWLAWRDRSLRTLVEVRWGWQVGRGLLGILMLSMFIYALKHMPLSHAYALFFVAPLLITALSVVLLGEHVGPRRWLAVATGFVGMLIILRPGFEAIDLATLAVLLTTLCYALNAVSVRILGRTDSTAAMSFWFVAVVAVGAGTLALPNWQSIDPSHAGLLIALGVTGTVGQVAITGAFRCAPISVVAPFEYTALIWGVALDLAIWGAVPPPIVFLGAGVIVGSGLYLIYHEKH